MPMKNKNLENRPIAFEEETEPGRPVSSNLFNSSAAKFAKFHEEKTSAIGIFSKTGRYGGTCNIHSAIYMSCREGQTPRYFKTNFQMFMMKLKRKFSIKNNQFLGVIHAK